MMARVRKSLDENQKGFTLVELLVVVVIIGILSAIAIPVYLNQQGKAKESAAKADLANAKTAIVLQLVENPTTTVTVGAVSATVTGFAPTESTEYVTVKKFDKTNGTFCIESKVKDVTTAVFSTTQSGGVEKKACA